MKLLHLRGILCFAAVCGAMLATSCAQVKPEPKLVKAEVFENRFHRVGMPETMHVTEFIGIKDGVAILRVSDMRIMGKGWKEEHIGVKLAELDPAFRAEVQKAAEKLKPGG